MDATTTNPTAAPFPGELVEMDGLRWEVDRETLTAGVYRLVLVESAGGDYPAGQVGFGHRSRLVVVTGPPA